jgi:hypothetical protein
MPVAYSVPELHELEAKRFAPTPQIFLERIPPVGKERNPDGEMM